MVTILVVAPTWSDRVGCTEDGIMGEQLNVKEEIHIICSTRMKIVSPNTQL